MKAIRIHEIGGPDVLVYEDAPMPEPIEGEVLVKVYAAGINPADWKTRQAGGFIKQSGAQMPVILGWDMSGVVESVGPGVTAFTPGQAVYGMVRFPKMGSAYAEYLTTPVSDIALKPEKIDHIHAAGVPLVGLTAWQALFEVAALETGQRILVQAAAGGVGHLAVQLAKRKGAYVIGTASAQNADYLHEIGVDELIDYTAVRFEDVLHDIDVVFNAANPEIATRSLKVLKHGAILVSVAGMPAPETIAEYDVRAKGMLVRPEATQLAELAKLIDAGKVKPYVDKVFPLAEAAKAHELGEQGHTRGKIVLKVRD